MVQSCILSAKNCICSMGHNVTDPSYWQSLLYCTIDVFDTNLLWSCAALLTVRRKIPTLDYNNELLVHSKCMLYFPAIPKGSV